MRRFAITLAALTVLVGATLAAAQSAQEQKVNPPIERQEVKKQPAGKRTPVIVEHAGSDPVGIKLAYVLKEMINNSSLLGLTAKDERKLVLSLTTKEEFADRPKLASVYGMAWLYSAKDGSLRYYLASSAGAVDAQSVEDTAQALLAKTATTAESFAYLFE